MFNKHLIHPTIKPLMVYGCLISLSFIFSFKFFALSLNKFVFDIYPILFVDDLVPLCLCDTLLFLVDAHLTETSHVSSFLAGESGQA